jgi:hypothetical protein
MQQPLSKLKMLIILKYVQSEQPGSGKSVQWEKATTWPGSSNKSIRAHAPTILNETTAKANGHRWASLLKKVMITSLFH